MIVRTNPEPRIRTGRPFKLTPQEEADIMLREYQATRGASRTKSGS